MREEAEPRYYCVMFWLQQMGIFHQFNFTMAYWFLFPLLRPKKNKINFESNVVKIYFHGDFAKCLQDNTRGVCLVSSVAVTVSSVDLAVYDRSLNVLACL